MITLFFVLVALAILAMVIYDIITEDHDLTILILVILLDFVLLVGLLAMRNILAQ